MCCCSSSTCRPSGPRGGLGSVARCVAVLALWLGWRSLAQSRVELGPWTGSVTSNSAVLKAKVRKPGYDVFLRLASEDGMDSRRLGPVTSLTNLHRVVTFPLEGLRPDTAYRASLEIKGTNEAAETARFRTFPAGPASFRFAFASCGRTGSTLATYDRIRGHQPLFFLCPGDLHYEDIRTNRVERFWAAYDKVLGSRVQARLYREVPLVYVWDDHDFGGNASDDRASSRPAARAAYELYAPHYPLPFSGPEQPICHAFSVGRVRFIVTDLRSQREPVTMADGPAKTMLGAAQKAWLKRELAEANGTHPLIFWVSPVPWNGSTRTNHYWSVTTNHLGYIHHEALDHPPAGGTKPSRPTGDSWAWYATEREEIAAFVRDQRIRGLVILHGDMHALAADDGRNSDFAPGGGAPIPVLAAAPLDQAWSIKGGPYSAGVYAPRKGEGCFGLVEVTDAGDVIRARFSGRTQDDVERVQLEVAMPAR